MRIYKTSIRKFIDYDHPGFNNNFLINTYDARAILYNDKSVLENHHLASSFAVLNKPEFNFFTSLSKTDFKSFRDTVVDMVLATGDFYFIYIYIYLYMITYYLYTSMIRFIAALHINITV